MKLKILSLVAATALFFASCGTTYETTSDNAAYNVNVPMNIRGSLSASYPDATDVVWNNYDINTVPIDWELTGWNTLDADDYAVTFNMGGNKYYAWYDANGNLVGSAYAINDYGRLPLAVSNLLRDKYTTYTIDGVQREMWRSQTAYEIKLKGSDDTTIKLLVDGNGNIIKEKLKD